MIKNNKYDVIIIGGGPAGLSAGLYAARTKLKTLMIEKGIIGGKMIEASLIDNYPGFPDGISGYELSELMLKQVNKYGLDINSTSVISIDTQGKNKLVKTEDGNFSAPTIIITGGSERQKLGVPGEKEFSGKGVSYCATCDGPFFQDKDVAIIGGGNAAVTEALHLIKFASKVTIIHRRDKFRATAVVQERAFSEPKINIIWDTIVEAIEGDKYVGKLRLLNVKDNALSYLEVAGVFVSIGLIPNTAYLKEILPLDDHGNIIVNNKMETEIPGIFAAGDIRHNSIRQVVAAAGDGAVAAMSAKNYISE
jgi:thioredoxin reductase (NADPH)